MSLKYFYCIAALQAFLILFIVFFFSNSPDSSTNMFFRYHPSMGDDQTWMLFHQVDEDMLLLIFLIEIFMLVLLIILSMLAIIVLKISSVDRTRLLKISKFISITEISLCVYFLVGTINFSQSLVSCDDFVFGKSPGCYMPDRIK